VVLNTSGSSAQQKGCGDSSSGKDQMAAGQIAEWTGLETHVKFGGRLEVLIRQVKTIFRYSEKHRKAISNL
jgi:hypothetical protein